ncbi:MAG: LysM peptidoglycan-binding domain-containing protein [Cytophagales bacterium]|nr:MAG: LysM peptidoglycan-binding domain-containing protein [Cytophagales bacterium]
MKKILRLFCLFSFLLFVLTITDAFAQKKKSFKQRVGDFIEFKIINKIWTPSDTASLNGKELETVQEDNKKDSLFLNEAGELQTKTSLSDEFGEGAKTGGGTLDENLSPEEEMKKIEATFKELTDFKKDTAFIKNLIKRTYESPLDLSEPKSLLREDNSYFYDVNTKKIVTIAEELAIDCVWVTLTNYYAIWDSQTINPYKYKIEEFKEPVDIQLFDSLSEEQQWSSPLANAQVTSNFGFRRYRWHSGIDLDLNIGDPVYASFDGIVRISSYVKGGYGRHIVLRHSNGLETLYGHLSKSNVSVGQEVKAGTEIGKGGNTGRSTGPHLHYEVRFQGHAFNPAEIYDFEANKVKTTIFRLSPDHFKHLTNRRQVVYHTVEKGETISEIARAYEISIRTLCRMNRIYSSTRLKIGRKLRVK